MRALAQEISNDTNMNALKQAFNLYNTRIEELLTSTLFAASARIWTDAEMEDAVQKVRTFAATYGVEMALKMLIDRPEHFGALRTETFFIFFHSDQAVRDVCNDVEVWFADIQRKHMQTLADACVGVFAEHDAVMAGRVIRFPRQA